MAGWPRVGQRGGGRIGAIIGLLLVVTAIYLAVKWIPVRTQRAEFTEYMEQVTRRFAINEINEQQMIESVLDYAGKEKIPLKEEDVTSSVSDQKVSLRVKYDYPIKLVFGKTWVQHADLYAETKRF